MEKKTNQSKYKNLTQVARKDLKIKHKGQPKEEILKVMSEKESMTIEEIHKRTGMSHPLLSYHINGNKKADGLIQDGFIIKNLSERVVFKDISITKTGKDLLKLLEKEDE